MRAWFASASSSRCITSMAEPSAITNPSRSRSNGRLARCGSSFRVDIAFIVENAPNDSGASGASAPPAERDAHVAAGDSRGTHRRSRRHPRRTSSSLRRSDHERRTRERRWPSPTRRTPTSRAGAAPRANLCCGTPHAALPRKRGRRAPIRSRRPRRPRCARRSRSRRHVEREPRRRDGELTVTVRPPQLFAADERTRIEIVDLRRDLRRAIARIETGQRRRRDLTGRACFPKTSRTPIPSGETMPIPVTTTR